jgi:Putative adhesin
MSLHLPMRHELRRTLAAVSVVLAAVALGACHLDISNRAEARDQWQRHYTLSQGGTFEIRNTNGLIHIEPGPGDAIDVSADRIVRGPDDAAAKEGLAQLEIQEVASSTGVTLDSTNRNAGLNLINLSRRVDYHVKVPEWANIKLNSTNGEIEITGPRLTGTFHATSTNGEISATGLENSASVETTNGSVSLNVSKLGEDGLSCETTNGRIAVTVPAGIKARLSARVTNGGITAGGLDVAVSEQSRRRLDGTIGGGGPLIRLQTTNGAVEIRGR